MSRAKAAASTANRILPGIQSFAWNSDRSLVAVCPYSSEILIFETNQKPNISDWRLTEVLREVSLSLISTTPSSMVYVESRNISLTSFLSSAQLKRELSRVPPNDWRTSLFLH
jgi:hypothetical protein